MRCRQARSMQHCLASTRGERLGSPEHGHQTFPFTHATTTRELSPAPASSAMPARDAHRATVAILSATAARASEATALHSPPTSPSPASTPCARQTWRRRGGGRGPPLNRALQGSMPSGLVRTGSDASGLVDESVDAQVGAGAPNHSATLTSSPLPHSPTLASAMTRG